jgi:transposase-like protein
MPKEKRRHRFPEEKLAVLREHLFDRKPISKLCEHYGIAPMPFLQGTA